PASLTDPTTGQVTVNFNADLMTSLTAGSYAIEVWVVDNTGTSIYPSDGSTGFTITNNIQSTNGSVITTITFDDFVEAMNKAASTIAKGDKGEPGPAGPQGASGKDAVIKVVTQAEYDSLTDKSGLYVIQG
ncbi:collagen-like protein, partial [Lactiplantibacillus plantarum]